MNLASNSTFQQLLQLICSVDDTQDSHILYVTKRGEVRLVPFRADTSVGAEYANEDTLQFILDTFLMGKGYTGQQAIQDREWMEELYSELMAHWACRTTGFAWENKLMGPMTYPLLYPTPGLDWTSSRFRSWCPGEGCPKLTSSAERPHGLVLVYSEGFVNSISRFDNMRFGPGQCLAAVLAKTKGILTKSAFDPVMTFASSINEKKV